MDERDMRLMDAATRYLELLESGQRVSLTAYLAAVEPDLRDELGPAIEELLTEEELDHIPTLAADEQITVGQVVARVLATALQPPQEVPASIRSLIELRDARDLSTRKLAQRVNLPVAIMGKIERGGVLPTSIPERLVARLAKALDETEVAIRAALATPLLATSVRLSAKDGTQVPPERAVTFAEAFAASAATPEQRSEWGAAG